jgi:hypothetical protein
MRDTQIQLQSSATILLSQIVKQAPFMIISYIYQVLDYIQGHLRNNVDSSCRRGISHFILTFMIACLVLFYQIVLSLGVELLTLVDEDLLKSLRRRIEQISTGGYDLVEQGHAKRILEQYQTLFLV